MGFLDLELSELVKREVQTKPIEFKSCALFRVHARESWESEQRLNVEAKNFVSGGGLDCSKETIQTKAWML